MIGGGFSRIVGGFFVMWESKKAAFETKLAGPVSGCLAGAKSFLKFCFFWVPGAQWDPQRPLGSTISWAHRAEFFQNNFFIIIISENLLASRLAGWVT